MRPVAERLLALAMLLAVTTAHAEYCIDWRSWLQKSSGQSGHCWATESECSSYYFSRCLSATYSHDCAGTCYYKPGLYPKTGQQGGKSATPGAGVSAETIAAQKKLEAQKKADAAAQEQQFRSDQGSLLGSLKGGIGSAPPNRMEIKLPPPSAGGQARKQLDCAANEARQSNTHPETREQGPDWDNGTAGCTAVTPAVPAVSAPAEAGTGSAHAPADMEQRAKLLAWLAGQLATARQNMSAADREVAAREQDVARETGPDKEKPAGESDALKRAREALARAKADRERAAAELQRLEQQESSARQDAAPGKAVDGQ